MCGFGGFSRPPAWCGSLSHFLSGSSYNRGDHEEFLFHEKLSVEGFGKFLTSDVVTRCRMARKSRTVSKIPEIFPVIHQYTCFFFLEGIEICLFTTSSRLQILRGLEAFRTGKRLSTGLRRPLLPFKHHPPSSAVVLVALDDGF